MLEITITKITGNRTSNRDELYTIEIYCLGNNEYFELYGYLKKFFKNKPGFLGQEIFNLEYFSVLYSTHIDTKNAFVAYLNELVFSDKFNCSLTITETNKCRAVYVISLVEEN